MSADSLDGLPYLLAADVTDQAARHHCWACAIALRAVGGLEVSSRLRGLADEYDRGMRNVSPPLALRR